MLVHDAIERRVDQRVAVQHGDRHVTLEVRKRASQATGGAQQLGLDHDLDPAGPLAAIDELHDLLGEVVSVDHHDLRALAAQVLELVLKQRLAADLHQHLGHLLTELAEARAPAGRKQQHLHDSTSASNSLTSS